MVLGLPQTSDLHVEDVEEEDKDDGEEKDDEHEAGEEEKKINMRQSSTAM